MELWQVWTTILATLPHGDCMYQLSFQGTSFQYSVIQLYLSLVEIRNPYLNLGWKFYLVRQRWEYFRYYLFYICKSKVLNYWYTITSDECLASDKIVLRNPLKWDTKKGTCSNGQIPFIIVRVIITLLQLPVRQPDVRWAHGRESKMRSSCQS